MVPDKFNMVDMEGIDIITSQGEEIPGLYQKLVESIAQCRYQCIYNWKFDGIFIPPTYVEMTIIDDVVWINEGVSVDEEDVIRIYSLDPPAPEPRLLALAVSANGDYLPPADYDGFSSVNVSVPEPVFDLLQVTANGTYHPPQGVDGFGAVEVAVPSSSPVLSSLSVTSNGTYTPPTGVDGYNEVEVDVPSSSPVLSSLSVISNGTYTPPAGVDGYNEVVVSVPSSGQNDAFINYDFTKCAGSIDQITYDSSGATFPSGSGAAFLLLQALKNDITIYVDVATMNLTAAAHRRFIMQSSTNGLIYRNTGKWAVYNGAWEESSLTDGSLFNNSKVKVYIDANGYWHIYKNNTLIWEPSAQMSLISSTLQIGSTSGSVIVDSVLTGLRVYNGNYTET